MRFTTVQINGLVAILVLAGIAAGIIWFLHAAPENVLLSSFGQSVMICLTMAVGGVVWVAKSWGGYAPTGDQRKAIAKDWDDTAAR